MEIQEIKIDGVVYVPARKEPCEMWCTGCALKDADCFICGSYLTPCDFFVEGGTILKVKED